MVVGLFLVVVGIAVTVAPTATGRASNTLRFVPYATDRDRVRLYRATGVVMIAAGIVAAVLL